MNNKESLSKTHRKNLVALAIILGTSNLVFDPACAQQPTAIVQEITSSENQFEQIKTPLWSPADFKDIEKKLLEGNYSTGLGYLKDPNAKPPFYRDARSLQWVSFHGRDQKLSASITLAQEFRELNFLNIYLPPSALGEIHKGAETFLSENGQGRLAAEARFLRMLNNKDGKFNGFEIQEVHYGPDKKPIFVSNSQFDKRFYKVGETQAVGKKLLDYYFMWPNY